MENHAVYLIRTIIQKYVKIRLHYIALNSIDKQKSNSQRDFETNSHYLKDNKAI